MSTTTQILFNSPALHSLKREQLVKLCKIHSIKANGKNTELIDRLKRRAQDLPLDEFPAEGLPQEIRSDDTSDSGGQVSRYELPRPSEQWEMVMEDIEEVQESSSSGTVSSKGSLGSKNSGEFGTASSKSSTIGSLKAFASSFGIKRADSTTTGPRFKALASNDKLAKHAVPYDQLPPSDSLPQTDHFRFSTPDVTMTDGDVSMSAPLPGSPSRPGMPPPADARLSMGTGMTTTIRLISTSTHRETPPTPHLEPFHTTFDIEMGTPGPNRVWPASPLQNQERLYPTVPFDDFPQAQAAAEPPADTDVAMPGGLSPAPSSGPSTSAQPHACLANMSATPKQDDTIDMFSPTKPTAQPFLFGSPLPRHSVSNKEFGSAAASVLEEMNRRLADTGAKKVNADVFASAPNTAGIFGDLAGASGGGKDGSQNADRFAKVHNNVFGKMDSITTHYAARRGMPPGAQSKKRKSDALGVGHAPGTKRKSNAAGARVISNGVRKNMGIPGGFGDEEEDEAQDAGDRRSSKRIRVVDSEDVHKGKTVSIAPPRDTGDNEDDEADQRKKDKERDAMRRKLDANKARRRSSRGRVSIGGKQPVAAKGKTSRFGFLSSAKSIVRNVWNMGAGSSNATKSAAPLTTNLPAKSSIPVAKPTLEAKAPAPKFTVAVAHSIAYPSGSSSNLLKPPAASVTSNNSGTINSVRSSTSFSAARARSPIPSFGAASRTSGLPKTRPASLWPGTAGSRIAMRPSSLAGASSMGTRTSMAAGPNAAVSSIGTRRSVVTASAASSTGSRRAIDGENGSTNRLQRTSSLLAPTASSLAKAQTSARSPPGNTTGRALGLPVVAEHKTVPRMMSASKAALDTITNSPKTPRLGRIFSQPLTAGFSSPASPKQTTSLTAAATTLLGTPSGIPKAVPPKPTTLIARKPRISRSRVIAKLGAQRAVSQSSGIALKPAIRTRSSMGARKSFGVKASRTSAGADVLRSAVKKRARQSEYARRRSHAPPAGVSEHAAMDTED
ncbi:hypothetical protein B0H21DRAFT_737235 [Amylocystis lapponica]|nr:hypothetical protein B0H21DRAFT_737235 [Amylocystis lapponica]